MSKEYEIKGITYNVDRYGYAKTSNIAVQFHTEQDTLSPGTKVKCLHKHFFTFNGEHLEDECLHYGGYQESLTVTSCRSHLEESGQAYARFIADEMAVSGAVATPDIPE